MNGHGHFQGPAREGHSYSIHDVVVENMNYSTCNACPRFFTEINSPTEIPRFKVHDIAIDHVTMVAEDPVGFQGGFLELGGQVMANVSWTNSIIPAGPYGAWNSGANKEKSCGAKTTSVKEIFDK